MEWLILLVMFLLGSINGFLTMHIFNDRKPKEQPSGTIHIETSDPDGPYMFLELEEDIMHKEEVLLRVDTKNYISHD